MNCRFFPSCSAAFIERYEERRKDNRDWPNWLNMAWNQDADTLGAVFPWTPNDGEGPVKIITLEGTMLVSFDDYIIQGVQGELYPCKPDVFAATYDAVEP